MVRGSVNLPLESTQPSSSTLMKRDDGIKEKEDLTKSGIQTQWFGCGVNISDSNNQVSDDQLYPHAVCLTYYYLPYKWAHPITIGRLGYFSVAAIYDMFNVISSDWWFTNICTCHQLSFTLRNLIENLIAIDFGELAMQREYAICVEYHHSKSFPLTRTYSWFSHRVEILPWYFMCFLMACSMCQVS